MKGPLPTPRGWTRFDLTAEALDKLLPEAEPHLGEGDVVGAWGWRDRSGCARRIELQFENAARWILRIGKDGGQSIEHKLKLRLTTGLKTGTEPG